MKWLVRVRNVLHNRQHYFVLLTPYLGVSFRVLLGISAVCLGANVLGHTAPPAPNPFVDYLDIFPGQSMTTLAVRGFSCQSVQNYYTTPAEGRCRLSPASGLFSDIEVAGSGQRVRETTFTLRANTLRLGDLLVMFNVPDFRAFSQTTFAYWRSYFVSLSTTHHIGLNRTNEHAWTITFTLADENQQTT